MKRLVSVGQVLLAGLGLFAALPAQDAVYPPGVTKEVHEAIERGLEWLVRNQANEGSWRNSGGYGSYPAAMTGLAGMALIAGGNTPTRGRYYESVRRAVAFLRKHADPNSGVISVPAEEGRSMYGHGFATLFLASVYGMEEDVRQSLDAGFRKHLTKPVTLQRLEAAIREVMDKDAVRDTKASLPAVGA